MSDRTQTSYVEYPALNVAVDSDLWRRVKERDKAALEELRAKVNSLVLYDHILCFCGNEEFVGLDKLYEYGVIQAVRLYAEIPAH